MGDEGQSEPADVTRTGQPGIHILMVKTNLAALTGLLLCVSACAANQNEEDSHLNDSIGTVVSRVREAREPERSRIAAELPKAVSRMDMAARQALRSSEIDELTKLLNDQSNTVQYFAAKAIGDLGPLAKMAVPAIRAAITRIEAEERAALLKPAMSRAAPLYEALHKITGEPVPDQ